MVGLPVVQPWCHLTKSPNKQTKYRAYWPVFLFTCKHSQRKGGQKTFFLLSNFFRLLSFFALKSHFSYFVCHTRTSSLSRNSFSFYYCWLHNITAFIRDRFLCVTPSVLIHRLGQTLINEDFPSQQPGNQRGSVDCSLSSVLCWEVVAVHQSVSQLNSGL